MDTFSITGQVVDVIHDRIFPATVKVAQGRIVSVAPAEVTPEQTYILPGFIDAHVHIESSMLIPSEFARLATVHGTVLPFPIRMKSAMSWDWKACAS